jgi:hypothetical protein
MVAKGLEMRDKRRRGDHCFCFLLPACILVRCAVPHQSQVCLENKSPPKARSKVRLIIILSFRTYCIVGGRKITRSILILANSDG